MALRQRLPHGLPREYTGCSAQAAPKAYYYDEISSYLKAGFIYGGVKDVEFTTVWGQGHTMAERTGNSTDNFIAWVTEIAQK